MTANRQKLSILILLLVAFLSYTAFIYTDLPVKYKLENENGDAGKLVWQKYNCNACHQIYGLGGYLGPDLTNIYSLKGNEYIKAFLKTGTRAMPQFNLSDEETSSLLSFLKDIDASGKADPKTFTPNYDGTIEQK